MTFKHLLHKNFSQPTLPTVYLLMIWCGALSMGCGDEQTIEEAAGDVRAPDGVLPMAGPKFCDARRPDASVACRKGESCIEALLEYTGDIEAMRQECIDDGGQLLATCTATDNTVLGACVENDILRVSYSDADAAQETCREDQFDWIACPSSDSNDLN